MSTMAQSLDEMAEELTCSICLSLFTTPVTLPCGHNFCTQCLDLSWKGAEDSQYSCPQCRYVFTSKPELRKNTLLSNLVSQVMAARKEDPDHQEQEEEEETPDSTPDKEAVLCDSCRKEAASKTCLTCMASFCQEHLMPHIQSPAFMDHLLSQPLRDLQQRKCQEHNKLMDHYCWEHGLCMCCYCALGHKTCKTYSLRDAKLQKELHYTNMLRSVNQKIEKAAITSEEVKSEQRRLLENTRKKKQLLEAEFEEIKSLIDEERSKAMAKIEEEERKVTSKFNFTQSVLIKKKQEYEKMSTRVQNLLQEQDELQFLKRASKLKDTTSKEPFKPKTEFDEKLLHGIYKNAVSLKDMVKSMISQMADNPEWRSQPTRKAPGSDPESASEEAGRWRSPGLTAGKPEEKSYKNASDWRSNDTRKKSGIDSGPDAEEAGRWRPSTPSTPGKPDEKMNKNKPKPKRVPKPTKADGNGPTPQEKPSSAPTARPSVSREELMTYAKKITANPNTVHKKIIISNLLTKLSVSDLPQNYPEGRERFVSCSQVLCSQDFSKGIHYWEIMKEGGNFSGLGVAYQSIARSGPESRLGRNKVSWCIEWCNGNLQAWHDDKQTDLTTPNTNKYGVLLNYDQGFVSFYCIGKKFSEIYKFRAKFTEPVYPAFWMFSNQTVLVLNAFHLEP